MPLSGPVTILLATIALTGLAGCIAAWRRPAHLARRLAHCRCGYPYAGVPGTTCPECGQPHDDTRRSTRADGIFFALTGWTLGALAATWAAAILLPNLLPPVLTQACTYNAPSRAGNIRFEWTVIDAQHAPRVTGLTATSSRPGAPVIALVPQDRDRGGANIAAAMTALLAPATDTPEADRARIAADLTAAATTALTGGLPGPPQDFAGFALYGSGPSGTGCIGQSAPRIDAAASLPYTLPPAILGGILLAARLARTRPAQEESRAPAGTPDLQS